MNDNLNADPHFLAGGGEMGGRIRGFEWVQTPLGPLASWPQSLKTAVQIVLGSRYPMFLWWGQALINLYNDAYAPILGQRHPAALGRSAFQVWEDVWPVVGPQALGVLNEGRSSWNEELLLIMERNGFAEEAYFTFSYSPVMGEDNMPGGVFCAVTEDTPGVLSKRRLKTLRDLGERSLAEAKTVVQTCRTAARTLAENLHDFPFALIYLLDREGREARLFGEVNIPRESKARPSAVRVGGGEDVWGLGRVLETSQVQAVDDLAERFGPLPAGPWLDDTTKRALVLPLAKPGVPGRPVGFLVAGLSPRLPFNDDYRDFLGMAAGHMASAMANAHAYEEERRRAKALAELDRAKTAFFSNVSHEFRTPLTLMIGPVEDLLGGRQGELSPAARGPLEVAHRNSLRLLRLVNTLLDFSRIEAGRVQAVYEPVDLAGFTAELASVFRAATERAGLGLAVDCPPLPEPVYVDRDMWEKVVLNLVSNAFKFTFEGGIEVALRAVGGMAELRVRDTGVGIPAETMPRLFERFHRGPNRRSRTHEGSGIGLALVQELVKLHGGSVRAESRLNEGTTFIVAVPLGKDHLPPDRIGARCNVASIADGAAPFVEEALRWLPEKSPSQEPVEPPVAAPELPPGPCPPGARDPSRLRIIVADDNADLRHYLARLLGELYHVQAVPDGQAALAAARQRRPDLILSDIMMPRLDGLGLVRELRADPGLKTVPIILLSARAGEESRVEGMQQGVDDYLIKPFSARELLARVGTHLQLAQARAEAARRERALEERLHSIIDNATAAIFAKDLEGRYILSNRYHAALLGCLPEEVMGKTDLEFEVVREGAEAFRHNDLRVLEARQPLEIEECVPAQDGLHVFLSIKFPLLDAAGEPYAVCGISTDITERKRTEQRASRQNSLLVGINQIFKETLTCQSEEELGRACLKVAEGVTQSKFGFIGEINLQTGKLDDIAISDPGWELCQIQNSSGHGKTVPLGFVIHGLYGRVLREGQGFYTNDPAAHPGRIGLPPGHPPLTAFLGVPLIREGKTIGMIAVGNRTGGYTPEQLEDLETLVPTVVQAFSRKRAEATLRQSEEKYRSLFNSMDEGFCILQLIFDPAGKPIDYRYLEINPVFEKHTGMKNAQGRTIRELVPEIEPLWFDIYGHVALTGQPTRFVDHAESMGRWFDVYAFRIGDASERKVAVLFTNITERKRRESHLALLAEIDRKCACLTSAGEIMEAVGAQIGSYLNIETCNFCETDDRHDGMTVLFGWRGNHAPNLLRTFRMSDYYSEEFKQSSRRGETIVIRDTQTDPRIVSQAYGLLGVLSFLSVPFHKDSVWKNSLTVTDSRPRDWRPDEIELFQELSARIFPRLERAKAEEALRQSEEKFRTLADNMSQFAWMADDKGRISWYNRRWFDYTGATLSEMEGWGWQTVHHPDHVNRVVEKISQCFQRGEIYEDTYPLRGKDGQYRWFLSRAVPIRDANGHLVRWFGTNTDITELREMEAALVKAKEAAESANRAKSQFLASMSHELRTPMTAILGMTDLALNQPLPLPARDFLQTSKESASQLLEILNEILDFSRIEAGRVELEYTAFHLSELVEQTVRALGVRAYEKGLELVYEIDGHLPVLVKGDPMRLRQVLTNLVGNAIKFTKTGEVVIEAGLERQETDQLVLRFAVRDTGIGISPENLERIFAPFTQADASTSRHYGGSGLGLAISQRLVQLMGGRLWAESQVGQGSVFFFTVALRPCEEAPEAGAELSYSLQEALKDQPVLVVSANQAQQRMLQSALASWSMRPEGVADVPQALTKIHQASALGRSFRLVIAEAVLPGLSGFTLADWLRRDAKLAGAVILMLSANERLQHAAQHPEEAQVYLDKPVGHSGLLRAISQALGLRSALPPPEPEGAEPSGCRPPARLLRVLLAEDSPANQKLVRHVLEERGHQIAIASNGWEALALLEQQSFDVVLMDVQMPELDGFEATRKMRALPDPAKAQVPIIALTAHALKGDQEKCLAAGMTAYLSKPIQAQEMIRLVEKVSLMPCRNSS